MMSDDTFQSRSSHYQDALGLLVHDAVIFQAATLRNKQSFDLFFVDRHLDSTTVHACMSRQKDTTRDQAIMWLPSMHHCLAYTKLFGKGTERVHSIAESNKRPSVGLSDNGPQAKHGPRRDGPRWHSVLRYLGSLSSIMKNQSIHQYRRWPFSSSVHNMCRLVRIPLTTNQLLLCLSIESEHGQCSTGKITYHCRQSSTANKQASKREGE
jgi:hypothetical protein